MGLIYELDLLMNVIGQDSRSTDDEPEAAAYLGLGSNLNDREANLAEAAARINSAGFRVTHASSIYETEPVGFASQPWFLNQVVAVAPRDADAANLLRLIKTIENEMGRKPSVPNGPRLIDIDLLLLGSLIINRAELTVPHPRLHSRRFVLLPLCEIAPGLTHPLFGKRCSRLLDELEDESIVRPFGINR